MVLSRMQEKKKDNTKRNCLKHFCGLTFYDQILQNDQHIHSKDLLAFADNLFELVSLFCRINYYYMVKVSDILCMYLF